MDHDIEEIDADGNIIGIGEETIPNTEPTPAPHITEFFFEEIRELSQKKVFQDVTKDIVGGDPNKLHLPPDIATSDKTGHMKPISREPQKKLMKFLKDVRFLEPHKIPRVKMGGNGMVELKACCATEVLKNDLEIEYLDERQDELDILCRQKSLELYHETGNFMVDDAMKVASKRHKLDQLRYVTEMEEYIPSIQCVCAKRGECSGLGSKEHTTTEKYNQQINPLLERQKLLFKAKKADNITFKSMKIKDLDNNLMSLSDIDKELGRLQKGIDKLQMGLRCDCTCFFCLEDRKHRDCDCSKFERRDKARQIIPHYKPKVHAKCKCEEQAQREKFENKNRNRLASSKYFLKKILKINTYFN